MQIALLGINYWPDETGIAPFTTGKCEYLASQGHDVTVFTGLPYYPAWRVPTRYRGRLFIREHRHNVTILRSWIYVPRRLNALRRVLHEASFVTSALMRSVGRGGKNRPQALITVTPPLALGLAAIFLSRIWKVPFVQHVPDLQPDAAVDLGMLRPGHITKCLYRMERLSYRNAAIISTLTESMRGRIVGKGINKDKVVTSPDWARPDLFAVPIEDNGLEFRKRYGLKDEFLVVHSGNMGVKQGLEVVLSAAQRSCGDANLKYLLVGDGATREKLQKQAGAMQLSNLRFLPILPDEQFIELLAACDVCLVTQQTNVADIVFPSKVITLMAAGRAIVASVSGSSDVARLLKKASAGLVVPAEDSASLAQAIAALRADHPRRREMAHNARQFARQNWNREMILTKLESELRALVDARAPKDPRSRCDCNFRKPSTSRSEHFV